ncbi:MAG: hypothetical protein N2439_05980 [Anaerolineae bacterium]|nr:hypothetical protein [Anaerolineae bacterium]
MVMLVLDDPARLDAVVEAWAAAGISGATIIESTGIYRHRVARRQVHARYAFGGGAAGEYGNVTLLAIVPDEATARQCLVAAESVVGDLDGPDTGVLAAWPLTLVKGVPRELSRARED